MSKPPPNRPVSYNAWLSRDERAKLLKLGGAQWLRAQIAAAELPAPRTWTTLEERNLMIVDDPRRAKITARDYGVSASTVYGLRAAAKLKSNLKE